MSTPFVPRVGGILSADIAVPDHERELRFYSRVLSTGDKPLWRDDLMNNQGAPIIGLGARTPEHADLPLQWMPHIQVADVAASARQAVDLILPIEARLSSVRRLAITSDQAATRHLIDSSAVNTPKFRATILHALFARQDRQQIDFLPRLATLALLAVHIPYLDWIRVDVGFSSLRFHS